MFLQDFQLFLKRYDLSVPLIFARMVLSEFQVVAHISFHVVNGRFLCAL